MAGPLVYFGRGRRIDVYNFTAADLPPTEMAAGQARLHRFGGAGIPGRGMTVAQHAFNLSHVVGDCPDRQRAALIHDAPEMFTGEVPRPIKSVCPDFVAVDDRIMLRLGEVFGVPAWAFEAIKEADTRIASDERLFMFDDLDPEDEQRCRERQLGITITPVTETVAANAWLRRFYQLFGEPTHV
ncbi:hypothetical protein [Methylobacterium aquaticum]|uniref:Predicted hydrolases of HD superfamily n=1 Tax=Methylobacterium aquaticum TaxID=270351 RepID=A0A0C6FT84_9HYPH|nr:hypothetical protein [Methylobacterium aquaticum]BAQ50267.1 predicted hydrolases of HD superfamily [Methylobacterium aquaticum]